MSTMVRPSLACPSLRTFLAIALTICAAVKTVAQSPAPTDPLQERAETKAKLVAMLPPNSTYLPDLSYVEGTQPGQSPDSIQTLDLYLPPGPGPFPLVLWIHGGGWEAGDKEVAGADLAIRFTKAGFALASLNYRLTTDAPFPAQIEDCFAALTWLRQHNAEYHLDSGRVGLMGHSAGAHLSALLAYTAATAAFGPSSANTAPVQAAVLWAAPTDLTRSPAWQPQTFVWNPQSTFTRKFYPGGEYNEDLARNASPITHVHPGNPPTLIVHGSTDELVPVTQATKLEAALRQADTPVHLRLDPTNGHNVMSEATYQEALIFFTALLYPNPVSP